LRCEGNQSLRLLQEVNLADLVSGDVIGIIGVVRPFEATKSCRRTQSRS
jgi:hypothetical protein